MPFALLLVSLVAVGSALPGQQVQAAIDAAIAAGSSPVTITPGVYEFEAASLRITGARGLLITMDGVTAIFSPGWGVVFENSSDTTLRGVTVDYSPACFTQGTIVAVDEPGTTFTLKLDAGYPSPNASFFASGEIKLQYFNDDATRRRVAGQPAAQLGSIGAANAAGDWVIAASGWQGYTPAIGLLATVSPRIGATQFQVPDYYRGQAWWVHGCANITSEDVTLLGSGNFAVTEWGGAGGHTYRRFTLTRARRNLLSSNTDCFHSFSAGVGPTIVDSSFSFCGDDFLNFHNRVGLVLQSSNESSLPPSLGSAARDGPTITVVDVGDIPSPSGGPADPARAFGDLAAGDTLRLYAPGTTGALLGTVVVAQPPVWVTDPGVVAAARQMAAALPYVSVNPAAVGAWSVTYIGEPLVGLGAQDIVQFDGRSSAGGVISNSTFSDAYDSCFRLQASNTAVVGSRFIRAYSGVAIVYDPDWLEGARGIRDVLLAGNCFEGVGAATSMDEILRVDADVTGLQALDNVVGAGACGPPR